MKDSHKRRSSFLTGLFAAAFLMSSSAVALAASGLTHDDSTQDQTPPAPTPMPTPSPTPLPTPSPAPSPSPSPTPSPMPSH